MCSGLQRRFLFTSITSLGGYASIIALWLCLIGLFRGNVTSNEVSKFSDTMYYVSSTWVPDFLPQGPQVERPQWLFQILIGPLLTNFGFLTASVVGRLGCYLFLAFGFAAVARALGLRLLWLLPAIVLFDRYPSIVAGEWVLGGVEPKVISYGFVLLALGSLLQEKRSPPGLALLLGLATSFHALVGLYATFAVSGLVAFQWRRTKFGVWEGAKALVVFLLSGAFALRPIIGHLFAPDVAPDSETGYPASYIYVFVRAAHHLDPGSWSSTWWLRLAAYLIVLLPCGLVLRRDAARRNDPLFGYAVEGLLIFCLLSLVPFFLGLIIANFDLQGRFLQYYLFRFGDVMLPLCTCLMVALAAQRWAAPRMTPMMAIGGRVATMAMVAMLFVGFVRQVRRVWQSPGPVPGISSSWKGCTEWVRGNTPADALFITSPRGTETFPLLARRRSLGTFKQVNMSGGLKRWYRRMSDLAATDEPWPERGWAATDWLGKRYLNLTTAQVQALMDKYEAPYFLTASSHQLDLPRFFENSGYVIYGAPNLAQNE